MITTTKMNLMIFIFLISIYFCCLFRMISELLIFINVQVVFQTFKLAVLAKVRGFFFWLLVTVMSICTTLIWVIKTTSLTVFNILAKYQSEYFAFLCLRFRDYKKRGIVGLSLREFSCSEFCSRLEIVAFAWLWWIMHHFDKNDNNYWNDSDDFFFNFNLFLLLISYDFRVIDFYQCPGCVPNF